MKSPVALAGSLAKGSGQGGNGSTLEVLVWLGASGAAAVIVLAIGRRLKAQAIADGIAGGLLFSIGDISTKLATQGGVRLDGEPVPAVPLDRPAAELDGRVLQLGRRRFARIRVGGA